jgi:hypothetical protein
VPLSLSESVDQLSPRGFSQSPVYRKLLVRVSEIVQGSCPGCSRRFRQILPAEDQLMEVLACRAGLRIRLRPVCLSTSELGRSAAADRKWGLPLGENPARQAGPAKRVLSGRKDFLDNHPDETRCWTKSVCPMREYSTAARSMAAFNQ